MAGAERIRNGYHNILRREILELIPQEAKTILDLGCGTGALGRAIKERQPCIVDGVELNKEAAKEAEKVLDSVVCDNLNRYDPTLDAKKYDCIILADILEHLVAPWYVLKKFAQVLTESGTVIASVPNIAHPWIISQLQKGLFRYEQAGILDVTHLRFFTKTTIFQLFTKAGLKITYTRPWPSENNPIQYHVIAEKASLPFPEPLVSILILTYNGWGYTEQCLASIQRYTDTPYKIIVIDNGSADETVQELRKKKSILHIENIGNLGFGRGFNIGLECIDTPYFVIANNDIIATQGWLSTMLRHIDSDDTLVALGPRSNYVSGPQIVKDVPYTNCTCLQAYALEQFTAIERPITYLQRVVFFCTLFKSIVLQKVGVLDERFEIGNFEDDDYCLRIKLAGLRAAFDNSVFIHHYGSKTFIENKLDYAKIMEENKQKFLKKWNIKEQ